MTYSQIIALRPSICYEYASEKSDMSSAEIENNEDVELMLNIAKGDEHSLSILINKWQSPLINFLYRSTQSVEEAEDIAQTVFVKIYRASSRYKPTAKFSTYLFHIARRQLINHYRSKQRKPIDFVDPTELKTHVAPLDSNESEIEEAFSKAMEKLPEKHKTAILLFKQQELSYNEIAESMSTNISTVKSWIHRARQTLKEELKDFYHNTANESI